ncbi:PspC domain-containing protein [Pleomorphovibrio marinus]|uniref:PspC domain-containing protein n=1 Tax=Pleomorphovibrio marinus TaxID=2164132 RepID=UPI000E0AAA11|nr:PspC domain-containing protein [Pleomorphovibrio marinus]
MKKTISINISGILFHIEEDGYTRLKKYLDAINEHFSHYDGNQEIITDIENRIAEIFLSNLKNNKQVITAENVDNLIEKMGTIADFKALEDGLDQEENSKEVEEENDFYKYVTPPDQHAAKGYKKLTRLPNNKILGGVCAGFAHYLSIDPLWTRLVTILLLFSGGLNFSRLPLGFISDRVDLHISLAWWTVLAYILLWIILPVSYDKPEDKNIKKLYRNPDDRVLGGVGSGLSAYFNIDVIWVRLGFVGLIFAGGSGFVLYLILWIITPLAKSITERIEMKGGAITLSNIENTIQQNLQVENATEESGTRKLLMAPFRFLGRLINGLGIALGPLGVFLLALIRVVFGLLVFFVGILVVITPLVFMGVYSELLTNNEWAYFFEDIPVEFMTEILPVWLAISIAVAILIPGIILTLLGISVLIKRNLIDARFGFICFALWLTSIMVCAFQVPKVISEFKESAEYENLMELNLPNETLVLKSNGETTNRRDWGRVSLVLKGSEDENAHLRQTFSSQGKNREDAMENATQVNYHFVLQDSVLTFDKQIEFPRNAKFRGQRLRQTLYLPQGKVFVLDRSLLPILRETIHSAGYKTRDVNSIHHWTINEEGLLCLNCVGDHKNSPADSLSRSAFKGSYFMNR